MDTAAFFVETKHALASTPGTPYPTLSRYRRHMNRVSRDMYPLSFLTYLIRPLSITWNHNVGRVMPAARREIWRGFSSIVLISAFPSCFQVHVFLPFRARVCLANSFKPPRMHLELQNSIMCECLAATIITARDRSQNHLAYRGSFTRCNERPRAVNIIRQLLELFLASLLDTTFASRLSPTI